jgi:hypothetical protein
MRKFIINLTVFVLAITSLLLAAEISAACVTRNSVYQGCSSWCQGASDVWAYAGCVQKCENDATNGLCPTKPKAGSKPVGQLDNSPTPVAPTKQVPKKLTGNQDGRTAASGANSSATGTNQRSKERLAAAADHGGVER